MFKVTLKCSESRVYIVSLV